MASATATATSGYQATGPIHTAAITSAPSTTPVAIAAGRLRPALFFGFGARLGQRLGVASGASGASLTAAPISVVSVCAFDTSA